MHINARISILVLHQTLWWGASSEILEAVACSHRVRIQQSGDFESFTLFEATRLELLCNVYGKAQTPLYVSITD